MDPPEATDAAPPHRRSQRRRGGTLLLLQRTLLFTVTFVVLSLFKLEPIARNSLQNHIEIDAPHNSEIGSMQQLNTTGGVKLSDEEDKHIKSPSYRNPYNKTVDVLSYGSRTRPDYQTAQARTWGSHTSIRNFFGVDESHDYDQTCFVNLTSDDAYSISKKCRTKNFGAKNGRPKDSALKSYERNVFARWQFLAKKSNPVGWMCNIPRPILGFASVVEYYKGRNVGQVLDFPDYLIIADDDTYFNMEIFQRELGNKPTENEPEAYGGCLVRWPFHQIKFTFPHGGFGLVLNKAALRNLVEPIFCEVETIDQDRNSFVTAACKRLQQPLYDEAQLFREGMSLIDLMVQYVTFQPYSKHREWETGFCQHGDWLWGYFLNFYNVTNHVAETDNLRNVGQNRLHAYMGSTIYAKASKNCMNEKEKCDEHSGVCHYQNPILMQSVNEKVFGSMDEKTSKAAFRLRDKKVDLSPIKVDDPHATPSPP